MYLGKTLDSRFGLAWQSWLHLILENYFGSRDRTWPVALENKKLWEEERDTWGKFLLLGQNKSSLWDYHDIILFLSQLYKPRWEMPYAAIY